MTRTIGLALVSLLLAGCASDEPAARTPSDPGDVEIVDIHGLALDPTDASVLYVATHRGLLRLDDDTSWSYVGEARDDFMGFTAHPTDPKTFWASGHPRMGGNLGVIRSTDGGETWTRIGAEGVDFHAMAASAADPERLYGFWRGAIQRSDDGGATWTVVSQQLASGLATHPAEADTLYAATTRSLARSLDAGATWTELPGGVAAVGVAVDPSAPSTLYAGVQGGVRKSADAGATWTALAMPDAGTFAFFATHAATPGLIYAASYQKGIYKSPDGGATWVTVLEPTR